MNGYGIYKSITMVFFLGFIVLAGFTACLYVPCREINREWTIRQQYGEGWRAEFEKSYGSVAEANTRIALGALGVMVIPALVYSLSRALRPEWQKTPSRKRPRRHRHESSEKRKARYLRNALLSNCLGITGILAGAALVLFRWGILEDPDEETVLGIVVYASGYIGVVKGCWWWLKAKAWTEEIVFIAFLPLGILFIPFVRLILFASPVMLPAGMGMMALILVAVVFSLPDKSGADGRGGSRIRGHIDRDR